MTDNIKYTLIAEVNDEEVFSSTYFDTTALQEELYKAERAVEKYIEEDAEVMEVPENE
jgi:hypothetical protein